MAFDAYGADTSGSSKKSDINWDELNKYTVETAQLEQRETLIGYVSVIADLGTQKIPDAEYISDVPEEDESDYIDDNPGTYFKTAYNWETKKDARYKCVPQKDRQCVAVAIDFPDIIVDKGQFFGNSNPQPLRIWMGNQFFNKNEGFMVVGRPTALKVTNLDKTNKTKKWSFGPLHLFYKMAVASKLIKPGEVFVQSDIDKLLGKAFQFEAQVYFKEGNDGKEYYTEYVKFVGALGRGQVEPELANQPALIQFYADNSEEDLQQLRSHIINTMKMSTNWEGSKIKEQIETSRGNTSDGGNDQNTQSSQTDPSPSAPSFSPDDDDIPF